MLVLVTEASTADDGWAAVVGIAITMVAAPLVTLYVTNRTARGRQPERSVSVPNTGTGVTEHSVGRMSDSQMDVLGDLSGTLTWLRDEVTGLKRTVAESVVHAERQDARINTLEGRLSEAISDLDHVYSWIEAGMPNPPGAPMRPPYVVKKAASNTI